MPAWHLRLTTNEGSVGVGDIAPWTGFGPSAIAVHNALQGLAARWTGMHIAGLDTLYEQVKTYASIPCIQYGLELAVLDLWTQHQKCALVSLLGGPDHRRVAVHRLVEDGPTAIQARQHGFQGVKLKLTGDTSTDRARLAAVRQAIPGIPIRIDVNGAWSRDAARTELDHLEQYGPCIVEQPLGASDLDGLATLISESSIPLAADESLAMDPQGALSVPGLAEIVVKPMFLGGLFVSREIVNTALARNISVCVTHAMDSNVGRLGALHFTASLPIDGLHGLSLIDDDATGYSVGHTPGVGVAA